MIEVVAVIVSVSVVAGAVLWARQRLVASQTAADAALRSAREQSERLLAEARQEVESTLAKSRAELAAAAKVEEDSLTAAQAALRNAEADFEGRRRRLDEERARLDARRREVEGRHAALGERERLVETQLEARHKELERVAGLSAEEAKAELVEALEDEARRQAAARIHAMEAEAAREVEARAQRLIAGAVQRLASTYVAEKTVAVVELPSDDMKGRIIGREGRNIRTFENVTGVDVIIDDTPEVVVLSCFSPLRREIARQALQRLVSDGRIHPARIEEVVEAVQREMTEGLRRGGEEAALRVGVAGLHPQLLEQLGSLSLRTIGGHNLLNHSIEVAEIASLLAAELNVEASLAARAGLLHDVGRAADQQSAEHHAAAGAELARRHGERPEVVEAIADNHVDSPRSLIGVLVQVADLVSKARPGARQESAPTSVKRLEDLERLAQSFHGVERAWAIQAGRELRVVVDFAKVSDQDALMLSQDLARRIEDELTYPGEVKIMVIREARAVDIAR